MSRARTRPRLTGALTALVLAGTLTACGTGGATTTGAGQNAGGSVTVAVGALSNGAATESPITVAPVESIRATLPAEIRDRGTLVVGLGALPAGFPPLAYIGTDDRTPTGAEPDLARLVAGVLGLEPEIANSTWENLFVGIDSGRTDVGFSNITVTEERKQKYDFAVYRKDELAFETLASSSWTFDGDHRALDGLTVAVGRGTNQEKILLEWQTRLQAEGGTLAVEYYPDNNATQLALESGRIDAYLGPNPGAAYQVAQSEGTPAPKRIAGTYSGAGETLQGLIGATSRRDSGLAQPVADAINHLIENGQYLQWLDAWGLAAESVDAAEVNPPGLPLDNS